MKRKISASPSGLVREIEELHEAKSANLKQRWRALYGTEAPRRISRDLLIRALAYRIQEKALGGLKPSTRRLLDEGCHRRFSAQVHSGSAANPTVKPGTVLLREWHGTQHQVIVRENGIVFNGKQYKSLSQVAYRITGTKWSGPLFFGLKANRQEQTNGAI